MAPDPDAWLSALRRFALASVLGHAAWETLQLPLYTIWFEGAPNEIAFAVIHCTGGDLLIASATLVLALLAFGRGWPANDTAYRNVAIAAIALAVAYTVFSEWHNVNVRRSWAYSPWMPTLPPFRTGLSPLAQWFVVPLLAFRLARSTSRS